MEIKKHLDKSKRLYTLEKQILNLSIDFDIDISTKLINEFFSGVQEIREAFIDYSVVPSEAFDGEEQTVEFLQAVLNNEEFYEIREKKNLIAFNYLFANTTVKWLNKEDSKFIAEVIENADENTLDKFYKLLSVGENDFNEDFELGEEVLYKWFDPYGYIVNLRKAGSILINTKELPSNFSHTVSTIKQCYAFQQYLAVIVLCRTSLEIALVDLYRKLGFTTNGSQTNSIAKGYFFTLRDQKDRKYPNEYDPSPSNLIELITRLPEYESFKDPIRTLYASLSSVVHGKGEIKKLKERAEEFMKETFWLIHDLYNVLN